MQDAFGGILSIVLIVVFLLLVEGVLGFTVSYSKAFRMKNVVLSTMEEYDNACCFKSGTACYKKIKYKAEKLGYSPAKLSCPSGFKLAYSGGESFFCYKANKSNSTVSGGKTYHIITQVDINIPIINNITGMTLFQVSGDTRVIYTKGLEGECS